MFQVEHVVTTRQRNPFLDVRPRLITETLREPVTRRIDLFPARLRRIHVPHAARRVQQATQTRVHEVVRLHLVVPVRAWQLDRLMDSGVPA